jgi:hypothetical protein
VIARRQVRARAWELGGLLDWPVLVGLAGHTGMIAEPRPPGPRQMPGTLPAAGYGGSPGCREAGDPTWGSVRISISASRAVTRVAEENAYTAALPASVGDCKGSISGLSAFVALISGMAESALCPAAAAGSRSCRAAGQGVPVAGGIAQLVRLVAFLCRVISRDGRGGAGAASLT